MGESGLPRCASDTYQYINRIIENALEQAEQTILKLKTRRDDTIIHAKNKSVKLSDKISAKNDDSAIYMRSPLNKIVSSTENFTDLNDRTEIGSSQAPTAVPPPRGKSVWNVVDLLRFPVDDDDQNLRHTDRIFESIDQKSIMLMREYTSPNKTHPYRQQLGIANEPKYSGFIDQQRQQQQIRFNDMPQRSGLSGQYRQQQLNGINNESLPGSQDLPSPSPNNTSSSTSSSSSPFIVASSSDVANNVDERRRPTKLNEKIDPMLHEETSESSSSTLHDDSQNPGGTFVASRSASDSSILNRPRPLFDPSSMDRQNGNNAEQKGRRGHHSSLEQELVAEQRAKLEEAERYASAQESDEMNGEDTPDEELVDERILQHKGRKSKTLWSVHQKVPHPSKHIVSSMVDASGRPKIVMKGWKPHYKVKKIWFKEKRPEE